MQANKAVLREERITIPTYEMGEMERLPVYKKICTNQGTKGDMYPYKSNDRQTMVLNPDHQYTALIMENDYIRVTVLPELGGRIYEGYDKVNDYNFVYKNNVIKPALITLNGAWISGGIEFNWPQHHRPTTFLPLEHTVTAQELDGSVTAWVGETEPMTGLKCLLGVNIHPDKSYITAKAKIYNPTTQQQPFHWWANLAVHVDESYRLMFPPDIDYITFHNRTHVSKFPFVKGQFGGYDLGDGLDIRNYKNIKAGISVFIFDSQYSFMSGYSDDLQMGTVHVADKYISPGKKFFTWGHCGNANAWCSNLTDHDGHYIEIMTGCYTDNQPDFTWITPHETKTFEQRWYSIHGLTDLKNATNEGAISVIEKDQGVLVQFNVTEAGKVTLDVNGALTTYNAVPGAVYEYYAAELKAVDDAKVIVANQDGIALVAWEKLPMFFDDKEVPTPRLAPKKPEEIETSDELYANGIHLEQYKSPLVMPEPYYQEMLNRDPYDLRANTAMATLAYRKGRFADAIPYLEAAVKRVTCRNSVPYDSDCYYQLGLVYKQLGDNKKALPLFKRAAWQYAYKSAAWYQCAEIELAQGDTAAALCDVDLCLEANYHSIRARGLKIALLAQLGQVEAALALAEDTLAWDKLAYSALFGKVLCGVANAAEEFVHILGNKTAAYLDVAESYASAGLYQQALQVLALSPIQTALLSCYVEYLKAQLDPCYQVGSTVDLDAAPMDEIFPNRPFDYTVLAFVSEQGNSAIAPYYLGCMLFHHDSFDETLACWQLAVARKPDFSDAHRALAEALYEGYGDAAAALTSLKKAYELDPTPLIVFEYYQLKKVMGATPQELVALFEANSEVAEGRIELVHQHLAMLVRAGRAEDALAYIETHEFYNYEGGEGIVSQLRTLVLITLGNKALAEGKPEQALAHFVAANEYAPNLREGAKHQQCQSHRLYHVAKGYREVGNAAQYQAFLSLAMQQYGALDEAEYYRGVAYREAGDFASAAKIFCNLKEMGEKMIGKEEVEFFLGFPTPLPYEMSQARFMNKAGKTARCLGCIGLGQFATAKEMIEEMRRDGMPIHWLELALSECEQK